MSALCGGSSKELALRKLNDKVVIGAGSGVSSADDRDFDGDTGKCGEERTGEACGDAGMNGCDKGLLSKINVFSSTDLLQEMVAGQPTETATLATYLVMTVVSRPVKRRRRREHFTWAVVPGNRV